MRKPTPEEMANTSPLAEGRELKLYDEGYTRIGCIVAPRGGA